MTNKHKIDQGISPETDLAEMNDDGKLILGAVGASDSDDWNTSILFQACATAAHMGEKGHINSKFDAVLAGLQAIGPKDPMEAMLAAQMIAVHNASMDCLGRASVPDQSAEARMNNLAMANKLSRTYATLLQALDRHRARGVQKVTVKHVHVNDGGKAVVGLVNMTRGEEKK